MRNVTRQFRRALADNERNFLAYADITLTNNVVLNLTNTEIWSGGFSFDEAVSEDESFTAIGSVIIGSAEIVINNIYEEYSQYDFINADVVLYIGMQFENRLEKIKIGVYRVDDAVYNGATVRLSLLDNIEQFDRPYSLSDLQYPATLEEIVRNACSVCGVTLANSSLQFPHYQLSIPDKPVEDSLTFREVVSWCATIAGCFVKCNADGEIVFDWFNTALFDESGTDLDGGTFNPWSSGTVYDGGTFRPWSEGDVYDGGDLHDDRPVHYITGLWSQNIAMDDVVITGVAANVIDDSENAQHDILTYSTGTTDYEIRIEPNNFITKTNAQQIVNWLGQQLIGLRFRKLNVSHLNDPSIETGDVAYVIDRKQNIYRALVTRTSFSISGEQTIVCGAETPSRNSATKFSSLTKGFVDSRKLLRKERTARNEAIAQLEQAIDESAGLYSTIVVQQTGGNIYYMHDQPDLADSKIVWKMTRDAWAVTNDWQGTDSATTSAHKWNAGLTVNGTLISEILNAVGVNADWINTGAISVKDDNNVETFYANVNTGVVRIKASSFSLTDGSTIQSIAETKASAAVSGQTQASIFNKLTNNGQTQGIYLNNGKIYINFSYAKGGTLTLGGSSNSNGVLVIKNASDTEIGRWSNAGLSVSSGTITGTTFNGGTINGATINAGGTGTYNAGLYVRDSSGSLLAQFTRTGATICGFNIGASAFYKNKTYVGHHNVSGCILSVNGLEVGNGSQYASIGSDGYTTIDGNTFWIADSGNASGYWQCAQRVESTSYHTGISSNRAVFGDSVWVAGSFSVSGTKNRAVDTEHYGTVGMNAFETASAHFADLGSGIIGEEGIVTIFFDPRFAETVEINADYQVFITRTSEKEVSWVEKKCGFFIVHGESNATFDWMLVCYQRDYVINRMEQIDKSDPFDDDTTPIIREDTTAQKLVEQAIAQFNYELEVVNYD